MEETNINLMNRTNHTQLTPYDQNEMKQQVGFSSMKIFDGEDLTYGDRKQLQQMQQRDWIQQQIQEKEKIQSNLENENKAFQQQTLTINKMREDLEKLHHKKRTDMMKAQKETNLQLMYEKYDREKNQKFNDEQDKQNHINYTTTNQFMTENTGTCQSELAQHRVIPYHWKGMNDYQKTEILQTVDQQRRENEIQSELRKDEENQFSIQTENDRLMVVNLEREKKKRQKEMLYHMKEFNLLAAKEQKLKLKHYYD